MFLSLHFTAVGIILLWFVANWLSLCKLHPQDTQVSESFLVTIYVAMCSSPESHSHPIPKILTKPFQAWVSCFPSQQWKRPPFPFSNQCEVTSCTVEGWCTVYRKHVQSTMGRYVPPNATGLSLCLSHIQTSLSLHSLPTGFSVPRKWSVNRDSVLFFAYSANQTLACLPRSHSTL